MTTATLAPVQAKPVSDSVNITNKPEVIAAAKRAAALKVIEKAGAAAKKEREALEDTILRPALAGKRYAILRGVKAYELSSQRSNSHIAKDELLQGWPEAYAATLRTTYFDFLTYNVTPAK